MTGSAQRREDIDPVGAALKILKNYPLCDHCLGRLFAKLGLDLGNDERGRAIKTLLSMKLHRMHEDGEIKREELRTYALNAGDPVTRLYRRIYEEKVEGVSCYVCNGRINRRYFKDHADRIYRLIREYDATSFLIGVSLSQEIMLRELEIASLLGLETSESIKNEIKREIGKMIRDKYGVEPDFEHPDIVVIINYDDDTYKLIVNPILYLGLYWKRGRNISHTTWINKAGIKQYPYSLEEFLNDRMNRVFESERIIHHASGREDVDARMLGTGRPLVVEVKRPKHRRIDMSVLNNILNTHIIRVCLFDKAERSTIEYLKGEGSKKSKVYKVLFYTESPLSEDQISKLENELTNATVEQLTPKRILRRKKEHIRRRKVYSVKVARIHDQVYEALVKCDGGLYVKELVHCDNGRTKPCFSGILGVKAHPVELDVIGVELAGYSTPEKCAMTLE